VENRPGVYELFHADRRVYVGKASRSLPTRLRNHERKLSGRTGLSLATVSFICLYVDEDLDATAPETLLIKKYRHMGGSPWNTNGFGNNDPGQRRNTSEIAADHFDALYPINLNTTVELASGSWRVEELLAEVKRKLPYNLRYERTSTAASHDYQALLHVESSAPSTRQIAELVLGVLPVAGGSSPPSPATPSSIRRPSPPRPRSRGGGTPPPAWWRRPAPPTPRHPPAINPCSAESQKTTMTLRSSSGRSGMGHGVATNPSATL
jgi:hypothetical protein